VILKLVGLHGDVYSDTEIDKQAQDDIKARVTKKKPLIEVTTTEEIKTEDPPKDQEKKDPAPVTLEEKIVMTQQDRLDIWETWANRQIDEFQKKPTQSALLSWVQGHIRKDLGALKEIDTRLYNQVNEAYSRRLNEIIEKQEG
jgi:hypothetical protein